MGFTRRLPYSTVSYVCFLLSSNPYYPVALMSSRDPIPVSRLHIVTDFSPACCDGAPFLPDNVISEAPKVLSGQISDAEWSTAMYHLQSITLQGIPSFCTQFWLYILFGSCAAVCIDPRYAKVIERLCDAIKEINAQLFSPKGLFMSLQRVGATCCKAGKLTLVIALTPDESKILQQEIGLH